MLKHRKIKAYACVWMALWVMLSGSANAQQPAMLDAQAFDQWMSELSNWGRWGADDERGTINLVTPEKRIAAAQLVQKGITVSLARKLLGQGAVDTTQVSQFNHQVTVAGNNGTVDASVDRYDMIFHGDFFTHLDTLCHVFHKGKMYNGFSQKLVDETGCQKLGVDQFAEGILTRGVLVDIPALKGVVVPEPGMPVTGDDMDAWEKKTGVVIQSGDAVLFRLGRGLAPEDKFGTTAGLHPSAVKWLKQRDVAIVGTDTNAELYIQDSLVGEGEAWHPPLSYVEGEWFPVHKLLLVAMGTQLFDNLDLNALQKEAKKQGRWVFMFTAAPLTVENGTGSPVNPLAVF